MKTTPLIFTGTFIISGMVFWIFYGKDLAWDVYAEGGSYWYSEEFSDSGKVIITCALSCLIASICTYFHPLILRLIKTKKTSKNIIDEAD